MEFKTRNGIYNLTETVVDTLKKCELDLTRNIGMNIIQVFNDKDDVINHINKVYEAFDYLSFNICMPYTVNDIQSLIISNNGTATIVFKDFNEEDEEEVYICDIDINEKGYEPIKAFMNGCTVFEGTEYPSKNLIFIQGEDGYYRTVSNISYEDILK